MSEKASSTKDAPKGILLDFGTFLKTLSGQCLREQSEPEEGKKWTEEGNGWKTLTVGSYLSNLLWTTAVEKKGNVDQAELSLKIQKAEREKTPIVLKDEERVLIRDLMERLQQLSPGVKRQVLFFLEGKDPFEI